MNHYSICWDCRRATGYCPWSKKLHPVKGWTAKLMKKTSSKPYDTYLVEDCPGFIRDAYDGGLKRYKGEE